MQLTKQQKHSLKLSGTRTELEMSEKAANAPKKKSESPRTTVQDHFKRNDKKVWLLESKIERKKGSSRLLYHVIKNIL